MKKWMAILLTAAAVISLSACGGGSEVPVTEETLPQPLWAMDEEDRPGEIPALTEETTGPMLPDQVTEETVSQITEETREAPEEVPRESGTEEVPSETETEETLSVNTEDYQMEEKFKSIPAEKVYAVKSVNIRLAGNVNSGTLGRLGQGKSVTRIGTSEDGWSAVIYEDKLCYISSDYLSTEEQPETPVNPNAPSEQEVDDMVYTIDDVNMREGPGFDRAVLCRVPEYIELHRTGIVSSGWCRVTYKDQEGFIASHYLAEKHPGQTEDELVTEEKTDDTVYTTREVNFRKGPGVKKAIIGRIPQGTKLNRIAVAENGWAKVTYEGQTGYVSGDYVSKEIPAEG